MSGGVLVVLGIALLLMFTAHGFPWIAVPVPHGMVVRALGGTDRQPAGVASHAQWSR
jgi:hypothetical protein